MQTSLARRQRHRRALGQRPRGRRGSTIVTAVGAIVVALFVGSLVVAGAGFVFAVGAYNHYAAGLPDPAQALQDIQFDQQTVIYDRTGKIELARLGDLKREIVTYADLTPEIIDATTAIEDKDFWVNAGFDPAGIVSAGLDTVSGRPRGASTITQQLVRAPAAARGIRGFHLRAQGPRDHPVHPADPGVPGRRGQAADHHRLPQPELLRQPELRREGRRQELLRQVAGRSDPRPGRDPGGDPPIADPRTTWSGTPSRSAWRTSPRAPSARSSSSSCPPDSEIVQRRNHVLDLMKTRSVLSGVRPRRRRVRRGQAGAGRARPAGLGHLEGAPVRLAGSPPARRDLLPADAGQLPAGGLRRLQGHHDPRLEHAEGRREMGLRGGPGAQRQGPRRRS